MKKYLLSVLLIVTIIISGSFFSYASDSEVDRSLVYLNDIRKGVSVGNLRIDDQLSQASLIHTKYMYYNNSFSSIEEDGKQFYRGQYATNRAMYYRYQEPYVYELLNKDSKTYNEVITNFLNNPYSRTVLLDPVYKDIGMGRFEGFYSLNLGGEERGSNEVVIYPYNGQDSVPITWDNKYHLDPYSQIGTKNVSYGLPITVTYYSDQLRVTKIDINEVSLFNKDTNRDVPCRRITPDKDKYLKNSIIVLPLEKYEYNTNYEIKIDITLYFNTGGKETIQETSIFKSEEDKNIKVHNNKLLTRAKCAEEIVKALNLRLLQPYSIKFHDVDIKSASAKYIYTAEEKGITNGIKGKDDSKQLYFRPDENVTKEQLYAMLVRGYENTYKTTVVYRKSKTKVMDLHNVSNWCKNDNYILKAESLNILVKDNNGNINPREYVTEDEFQEILEKFYKAINK